MEAAGASEIGVSANDEAIKVALAGTRAQVLPTAEGPSQSVAEAAERLGFPLLIIMVDHVLFKLEWITQFLVDTSDWVEVVVFLVFEVRVQAAASQTKRTYLKFCDGCYSGCNLFLLRDARAMGVVSLWRKVEALRKQPWKIAAMLGLSFLLRYALGLLILD